MLLFLCVEVNCSDRIFLTKVRKAHNIESKDNEEVYIVEFEVEK